jgi:hypothetical protein
MTATVQLQSVGRFPAMPAGEVKVGQKLAWNFGYTSEVTAILKETKSQVILEMVSLNGSHKGTVWQKRMGKARLVAVA